jgi:hypothetical protein
VLNCGENNEWSLFLRARLVACRHHPGVRDAAGVHARETTLQTRCGDSTAHD